MNTAVIYARFSSSSQREESIEGQLKACYEYAKSNKLTVINEYIDRAQTGTNDQRAAFQKMIADSASKQFEAVIVYQFDRFARNRYDSAVNKDRLRKNGVRVLSAKENISDDPSGVMLEGILEALAEYYSADLSQKIRRGHHTNAEKCIYNGGPIPLGYTVDETRHFQIDDDTAPIVQRAFEQYLQGKNINEIVGELNAAGLKTRRNTPYAKNSLQKILRNRRYLGIYIYDDVETVGGMPRLIDDDTFNAVQKKLGEKTHTRASVADYLLTTKLFCGHCESMMIGVSGTSKTGRVHNYYTCKNTRQKTCDKKNVRQKPIEDSVVDECRKALTDENIDLIASKVSSLCEKEANNPYAKQLRKEIAQTETAIENLLAALERGEEADLLLERIKAKRKEKEELKRQLALEELSKTLLTEPEIRFFLSELKNGNINSTRYRKMLVNVLVNKIYLYDDRATIFFNAGGKPVEITAELRENTEREQGSYSVNFAPPFVSNA